LSSHVLKITIFNKWFIFLMFFYRFFTHGVRGLQKYEWNIDYSLEHQTTWGRNVESFSTCWVLLRAFNRSTKLNTSGVTF
jgi:hypothetical protein